MPPSMPKSREHAQPPTTESHARLTIYGRKPVIEALEDAAVPVLRVFVSTRAGGPVVDRIRQLAERRAAPVTRLDPLALSRISKHGRQDQGIAADIATPQRRTVEAFLAEGLPQHALSLAIDGLTTQANVGMVIRSALAAGVDGIVLPEKGTAGLDPQVLKASAGTALRAPILSCHELSDALTACAYAGAEIIGLDMRGEATVFEAVLPGPAVLVVGSESAGFSEAVANLMSRRITIPMRGGVESLNAAVAASVALFAIATGRGGGRAGG